MKEIQIISTMRHCDYCLLADYRSREMMEEHEAQCTRNPALRACGSCYYREEEENDTFYCAAYEFNVSGYVLSCPQWKNEVVQMD